MLVKTSPVVDAQEVKTLIDGPLFTVYGDCVRGFDEGVGWWR